MIINEVTDDLNTLVAEYMATNPEYVKDGSLLRMSRAGTCARQLDYELQGTIPPMETHQMLRMERGKYLHEMWQKIMSAALGDDFIEIEREVIRELKVEMADGSVDIISIPGHYDGLIKSMDAIYELKNVSEYSFQMVEAQCKPHAADLEQANYYAHARGASSVVMHYFNSSSVNSIRFHIPYDKVLGEKTDAKFRNRVINLREKRMEARPFHDATATPCWFCKFKDDCYKDFKAEVKAYDGVEFECPPAHIDCNLSMAISDSAASRLNRLSEERREKLCKGIIIKEMMSRKTNKLKFIFEGEAVAEITLKIGAKNNPLVTIKELKHDSDSSKKG